MDNQKTVEYDIAIVGAGPGGVAAAIALTHHKTELKIAVIEKAVFPREKVCGDAVPSWVFNDLEEVAPGIHERFLSIVKPPVFRKTSVFNSKSKSLTIEWNGPGYMVPRVDLDDFLLNQLSKEQGVSVLQGCHVKKVTRVDGQFLLYDAKDSLIMSARFLIGADGAPSTMAQNLNPCFRLQANPGSAVRCYFENLNIRDFETSRIYFSRKYTPGYFWIFPIGPNRANVGYGMIEKHRKKRKINLRDAFDYFLENQDDVKEILSKGKQIGELKGGYLPFSKGVGSVIGPGFAFIGDAANLNDPLTGDGIRNAVISGILAGKALSEMSDAESLNEVILSQYKMSLKSRLHSELKFRANFVKFGSLTPGLVEYAVSIGSTKLGQRWINRWI